MTAIHIQQLCKTYKGGFQALKGVDLSIKKGSFFGLLGPNGAGKSTIIGILSNLVNKTSGSIDILGQPMDIKSKSHSIHIGVVPQEFNLNMFEPCMQIICNQAGFYGVDYKTAKKRAEKYLKKMGLWDKRNTPSGQLSGGLKRRLMIVRALIHEPQILILDEPTAGVDITLRHSMWSFLSELNEAGLSIILTTHYLEEAEKLCDTIAIINHGQVLKVGDKQTLINTLKKEQLILHCKPFDHEPILENVAIKSVSNHNITLMIDETKQLSDIISELEKQAIFVNRISQANSKLEDLFLELVS